MDNDQLTQITSDDDWLELRDGERGIVRGRLHGPLRTGADGMIVSNVAWEVIAISLPDGYSGTDEPAGRSVVVVVERDEDGIRTTTGDILVKNDGE